jgi:hypothetical protein
VTTDVAVVVSVLVVVRSRVCVAVSVTNLVAVSRTVERDVTFVVTVWVTGYGTETTAVVVAVVAIMGAPPKYIIMPAPIMKPTMAAIRRGGATFCPAIL